MKKKKLVFALAITIIATLSAIGCASGNGSNSTGQTVVSENVVSEDAISEDAVSEDAIFDDVVILPESGNGEIETEETTADAENEEDAENASEEPQQQIIAQFTQTNGKEYLFVAYRGEFISDFSYDVTYELIDAASGDVIQQFESMAGICNEYEYDIHYLEDINFDGYLDLSVLAYNGACNRSFDFFLWNPEEDQFVETTIFSRSGANYVVNPNTQRIYQHCHGSAYSGIDSSYQWVDPMTCEIVCCLDYLCI